MKEKKSIKDGVYIPTLQAKDIYSANHLKDKSEDIQGFSLYRQGDETTGKVLNTKKFLSCLDYSLELIELEKIYKKIYRNNGFITTINNKNYSTKVIAVEFDYSYKKFNKVGKNFYVLEGYKLSELELKDGVCIKLSTEFIDGMETQIEELVAVQTNTEFEDCVDISAYSDYFETKDNKYIQSKQFGSLLSRKELRENLYIKGFYCDGIKYVRYKRSAGSSRVGKCLFIQEGLYDRIFKWQCCELKIKEGDPIDLASFEAYIALTMSSIIGTIELKPENILLVDDYESIFEEEVIEVTTDESNNTQADECMATIKNSLFDGESLIDTSAMGDYKDYGMILLRNRFCKTASFNTNIQKFLKDNNITDISQLKGKTLAKKIEDIKFITTPSSVKYSKFGTFEQWLENIDTIFGVVKHEKPTHFFDGRMVQTHYQLVNTCELSKEEVKELIAPTLDYIYKIKTDPEVMKFHIKCPKILDLNEECSVPDTNSAIYKVMMVNDKFKDTKLYRDFKRTVIKSTIRKLRQGHILINGNYSTLFGNGYEMLLSSIGKFDGTSEIGKGNIYCKNFEWNKKILGSRSPHPSSGCILLANNIFNENIDKYFNLTKEIVYVNAIEENLQQRLSGADYDSDVVLLTDNPILIKAAEKNYDKFKVAVCAVDGSLTQRHYNKRQMADLDDKTSVNKIGEIINLSQQLNSILWDNIIGKHQTIEENIELYKDISILTVLSGIEIDFSLRVQKCA